MITKVVGKKVQVEFEIGEYDPALMDLLTLLDITAKSQAEDDDIEALSEEINRNWWRKNKGRFLGESCH